MRPRGSEYVALLPHRSVMDADRERPLRQLIGIEAPNNDVSVVRTRPADPWHFARVTYTIIDYQQ